MTPQLKRVLDLLWEYTAERIDKLPRTSPALERILLERAAESERRLIADICDWEAYPPNACSCPATRTPADQFRPKKRDWDYRMYSRSCMRGDHQREAKFPGQGVD